MRGKINLFEAIYRKVARKPLCIGVQLKYGKKNRVAKLLPDIFTILILANDNLFGYLTLIGINF
jgi:hypothetical protein